MSHKSSLQIYEKTAKPHRTHKDNNILVAISVITYHNFFIGRNICTSESRLKKNKIKHPPVSGSSKHTKKHKVSQILQDNVISCSSNE